MPVRVSALSTVIRERRTTRMFLPDRPVPRDLLDEALELAMRAPSNSNIQPWRLFLATGARRKRLGEELMRRASAGFPATAGIPESFAALRRELGAVVYGSMGVARDDAEARRLAQLRNFDFFGAPTAGAICMHRDLGHADSLAVGMFLQTLLLAPTERGLATCVQVSVAHFPDVLRDGLEIPDELRVLCGLGIGYADPDFPTNHLRIPRNPVAANVVLLDD
ncbi:nitroreductase [Mycolicibacterium flavescens]|uniref:Oxidoreductase n=1 Tax=Mycolicibacterium flavescens TaxID=1776 RepID=A0A1E3RRE9_MYCFV|nr:nitroreductase [Mycolicibacterium flavescens]MCV7279776.1 nitroreductase [Mycolicibacterium flavescens]ODQ92411.1 oxidoreductase [Mycolicibacterium flavescens]